MAPARKVPRGDLPDPDVGRTATVQSGQLTKDKLLDILRQLNLPPGEFVVFGGGSLVVHELRRGDDIDMFVSRPLYKKLKTAGWEEKIIRAEDPPLLETYVDGHKINAWYAWNDRDFQPDIQRLLRHPEVVEGYPFMSLEELHAWKKGGPRPKDMADVELIERHFEDEEGA